MMIDSTKMPFKQKEWLSIAVRYLNKNCEFQEKILEVKEIEI